MKWIGKEELPEITSVRETLKTILDGLGYKLIELTVSRHKGSVQIRAVIYNGSGIGTNDCTKVHRVIMPRLEIAFDGQEIYLEVSSPGIDRAIKDGMEFTHYLGRGVRCYRTDITEWTAGILESAGENGIILKTEDGRVNLKFDIIAKAKLNSPTAAQAVSSSQEV
ncbi:MAG: ribosome assembly cofactor RimP [Treponema sp.]|nr:ribosome assembly cofactor RimP [Treponema sp.]